MTRTPHLKRWQGVLIGSLATLLLLIVVFDWNWLRKPLETYISRVTEREFRISSLDVDLGLTPTIKLTDVYFANASWSKTGEPMARIGRLEFTVSLRDLWDHKIQVPHATLTQAKLVFERASDGHKNWVLKPPSRTTEPGRVRLSTLAVDQSELRYMDYGKSFSVDIQANSLAPDAAATVAKAGRSDNNSYTTRHVFSGKYHGAAFHGDAVTGDVLSFQESDLAFPIKGHVLAGSTEATVEGSIADMAHISSIDVQLAIHGRTLASLYPFLLLPLPASPPYAFRGHLVQKGSRYGIDDLAGKIGSTDIAGSAAYVQKEPRPLLTATLHSKLLDITDLGPIIGLETPDTQGRRSGTGIKDSPQPVPVTGSPPLSPVTSRPTQSDTNTRAQAQRKERQTGGARTLPTGSLAARGEGVLPSGKFEAGRLKAIDAEVDYSAAKLQAPSALPIENMAFSFRLHDAVAKLAPLEFGLAGGRMVSEVTIDASREGALRSTVNADFRNIQVARLFPALPSIAAKGAGELGAQIRLAGTGNSIADAAGDSSGSVTAAIAGGKISNLLDAMAGLNGGKVISLLVGGDKDIAVNCGGVAFDVEDGVGRSRVFVIDTEQTRIDGSGSISLKDEQLNLAVAPKPKDPGILSLRTPAHVTGSFRHPRIKLDKEPLMLRAGAAVALAVLNPLAALIPLIETGPGADTDCARLLAQVRGAQQQAGATGTALPR